jgi:hypothetical protein
LAPVADFFPLARAPQDGSGFIEASEVLAVADKVCRGAGIAKAPTPAVNMIFDKVTVTE